MYDAEKLASDAYARMEDLVEDLKRIAKRDYGDRLSELKPGMKVPTNNGKVKTDEGRMKLAAAAQEARDDVKKLCDKARKDAELEMCEPPKADALSYVDALCKREGVTVEEMTAAIREYGDNWTLFSMMREKVERERKHGDRAFYKVVAENTLDGYAKAVDGVQRESTAFISFVAGQGYKDVDNLEFRLGTIKTAIYSRAGGIGGNSSMFSGFVNAQRGFGGM